MYKNQLVKMLRENGEVIERYHILMNKIPVFRANVFLDYAGRNSINTSKQYAHRLCKYFNFLEGKRNKTFLEANKSDILKFIDELIFGGKKAFYIGAGKVTYNTASHYLTVIKEFYCFLEDEMGMDTELKLDTKRINAKSSFLYGQIWNMDIKTILNNRISRTKGTKEYIKWYTDQEKEAIMYNFNTLRDKAIFLLTLEGLRIEEVLSLRVIDFNSIDMEISIYKSKGRENGNVGAVVILPMDTVKVIDDYLFTERDESIIRMQEKYPYSDFPNELFLNLKNNSFIGQPLSYRNYIKILKRVANKAGLDSEKIRTHSGRSTKTMELLHHQVTHPEDNLTDEQIRQMMRWANPNSIQPYINTQDKRIAIVTAKRIQGYKEGNKDE